MTIVNVVISKEDGEVLEQLTVEENWLTEVELARQIERVLGRAREHWTVENKNDSDL